METYLENMYASFLCPLIPTPLCTVNVEDALSSYRGEISALHKSLSTQPNVLLCQNIPWREAEKTLIKKQLCGLSF